jgi:transposase
MRKGAEYFLDPAEPAQRRYEAVRAYILEQASAAEAGARFGYSPATVRQMAADLRGGKLALFVSAKPGPKGPRKQAAIRDRVLALRATDRSITEIAEQLTAEGSPVSHDTVWQILRAEGIERLTVRAAAERGAAARAPATKAKPLEGWPAGARIASEHAGLFLLLPAICDLGFHGAVAAAGYPGTKALSAWHSLASLLLCKLARHKRIHHVADLVADPGVGLAVGLNVLPKTSHLAGYSHRVPRSANEALLSHLVKRTLEVGLVTGEAGFNLDFHAIRNTGELAPLERNYVPKRSQSVPSVLAFFAQDHASQEMVYSNADVTKASQAREILAFCAWWRDLAGHDPEPLVFDSKLTTYEVLDELGANGVRWLTLRHRGKRELERINNLPRGAWTKARIDRVGRYRTPHLYDETITIKGIGYPLRQIAVKNIGREQPTLLITNDLHTPAKQLFARYAERMLVENELAYLINGFHLDALSSGLALNVDLDTTLTVAAANTYRLFARDLPRYERAQPERLHRDFIDTPGTITIDRTGLNQGTYQSQLRFIGDGQELVVVVHMQVGEISVDGELTQLYVLLLDRETREVLYQAETQTTDTGELQYHFDWVAAGSYWVIAGSDIDVDLIICQSGESCGAYPSLSNQEPVQVGGTPVAHVDFVADILGNVSTLVSPSSVGVQLEGIPRNAPQTPAPPRRVAH